MATFIGTDEEFRRHIGPRLRNLVNQITRKHKKEVLACEHCGTQENLEAAHIKGRGRTEIIDMLLQKFSRADIVNIDLETFERKFIKEHHPIEKTILVLCQGCHRQYDSDQQNQTINNINYPRSLSKTTDDTLLITLDPSDSELFKKEIMDSKRAEIVTNYSDGRVVRKRWKANKITESSNILGNLWSRPEFRSGNWQQLGIENVHVKIIKQ